MTVEQIIRGRYLEQTKLKTLLDSIFGPESYKVSIRSSLELVLLTIPRPLTEDEISSVSAYEVKRAQIASGSSRPRLRRLQSGKSSIEGKGTRPLVVGQVSRQAAETKATPPVTPIEFSNGRFIVPANEGLEAHDGMLASCTIEFPLERPETNSGAPTISGYLHACGVVSEGQTCTVYGIRASVSWNYDSGDREQRETTKMAIKRLSRETTAEHFFREYEILKSVKEGCHTNIVQIIKAFSDLEDDEIIYNFVFPLALGNLKQLFNDVIMDDILHKASNTLWYQFEGLASAVAFLHENGVAHNDIKPSNVLLYKDPDGQRLLAKIADFGLAIGTEGQARFEFGTEEAKSAFKYDAPEIRSRRRKDTPDFIAEAPATFKDLWMGDIWKLAAVFTELLSHLVLGTNGVSQFRNYVTTTDGNFESDRFEDIPITYDDDVKVKDEVRMWLDKMGDLEARAKEVVPLLQDMFGEASTRPTAEDLTRRLRETSLSLFTDGTRIVRFLNSSMVQHLSIFDRGKSFVERWVGTQIDWRPFVPPSNPCPPDTIRIIWKWCEEELSIDIALPLAQQYKDKCLPLSGVVHPRSGVPLQTMSPAHLSSGSSSLQSQQFSVRGSPLTQHEDNRANLPAITTMAQTRSDHLQSRFLEIYWCVDKPWSERVITVVRPFPINDTTQDIPFCRQLLNEYHTVRGFLGRWFSWKTCVDVKFINFSRVFTSQDEVAKIKDGLPGTTEYLYSPISPDEVHMAIAAKQVVASMHRSRRTVNLKQTLPLIPKKREQAFNLITGSQGWGMHAIQGFAIKRIFAWIATLTILVLVFAFCWLYFINKTDLTNAFVPAGFFATMMGLALAVPQLLANA